MEQHLQIDEARIAANEEIRNGMMPFHILQRMVENVADGKDEIKTLFESATRVRDAEKPVRDFVSKRIVDATKGRIAVVEYSQKQMAKQDMYLFVGTHWAKIRTQMYYDFVKEATRKVGLLESYVEDQKFMNQVFEQVAFRVSQFREQLIPGNEVWLNVQNGTLRIDERGEVRLDEHRKEDFFLYVLPYAYDPACECPLWMAFLDRVLPEKEMQTLLAEYIGYCFTRSLKLEKMAVFYGTGANGKSVTMDLIEALMGRSNVSYITMSDVTMDAEKRSLIENKLVNISSESGRELDFAMMKKMVSGEPTEVRILYKGTHTMYQYAKFITSYNKLPHTENTFGFFRRWLLFPFKVTIPEEEQDVDLVQKLKKELPGIMNWVLGALGGLLQRKAFTKSKMCNEALQDYKLQTNSVLLFLDQCCEKAEDGRTKTTELYDKYKAFCKDEEIKNLFGKKMFREILKNNGIETCVTHGSCHYQLKLKDKNDEYAF